MKKILASLVCLFMYTAAIANEDCGFIYTCTSTIVIEKDGVDGKTYNATAQSRGRMSAIKNSFFVGHKDFSKLCEVEMMAQYNSEYFVEWRTPPVKDTIYECSYSCYEDAE
jgi:hypothetical protein